MTEETEVQGKIEEFPKEATSIGETPIEETKPAMKPKRDIIRFNSTKQTAINLEHVSVISLEGKVICFEFYNRTQSIDFLDEASASSVFEGILQLWTAERE